MASTGGRRKPQKYPDELRERAVRLVVEIRRETGERHGTITRVARELGVGPEPLRNWVNAAEPNGVEDARCPRFVDDDGVMRGRVAQVSDVDWVSQFDAAERLDLSMWAIGQFIATGRLTPEENPAGQAGVTRASIDAEASWRRSATRWQRFWRRLREQSRFC